MHNEAEVTSILSEINSILPGEWTFTYNKDFIRYEGYNPKAKHTHLTAIHRKEINSDVFVQQIRKYLDEWKNTPDYTG